MEEKTSIREKLSYLSQPPIGLRNYTELAGKMENISRKEAERHTRRPKMLALPDKNKDCNQATVFLKEHGIDGTVIKYLADQGYLYEDVQGNCIFVGYDDDAPKYGMLYRTENKKMAGIELPGSHKFVSWPIPAGEPSELLQVYEYPIAAMLKMTREKAAGLSWTAKHHLAVGGFYIEPVYYYTKSHPEITTIIFCYGDDIAGQSIAERHIKAFHSRGYTCSIESIKNDNA